MPEPLINFIKSNCSPYLPKIIRLIPIVTANIHGPVRSPRAFDNPRASELAMAQWASAYAESALGLSKALGDLTGPQQ